MYRILIPLLLYVFNLSGLEVKSCFIKDRQKHEANQSLLSEIIKQETENIEPKDQAKHLSQKVKQIASKLLQKGFFLDAYDVPPPNNSSVLSFNCFALWEGEGIPLTFFVYIWPGEEIALQHNSRDHFNRFYGSIIHSHPIPCAFAVLQGSLVQKNYEPVGLNKIRLVKEEIFHQGQGDFDNLNKDFIHKLYCRDSKKCLSLHAYGLPTAEKVMTCFRETHAKCSYENHELVE